MGTLVPAASMFFMGLSAVLVLALPTALFFYLKRKHNTNIIAFFTGAAVMLVFAFVLENIAVQIIMTTALWGKITASLPLTALFGGLMAGLFEETGRFTAFKTVLGRKRENDYNAIMYGVGHGGFEAVVLLLPAMINNLIYSVLINTGSTAAVTSQVSGEMLASLENVFEQLKTLPPWYFAIGFAERLAAIALHISLSVMVWFAAEKGGRKIWLFAAAIAIHAAVDFVAGYMSLSGADALAIEALTYIMALAVAAAAFIVWKRNRNADNGESWEAAQG